MIGSNDLERARGFYDATFAALGGKPGEMDARGRLIYVHEGGRLMITKPINGKLATAANGATIGIAAASHDHVLAWHAAGAANGGTAIESPPAERPNGASLHIFAIPTETNRVHGLSRRSEVSTSIVCWTA
jgi:hypothetical protein